MKKVSTKEPVATPVTAAIPVNAVVAEEASEKRSFSLLAFLETPEETDSFVMDVLRATSKDTGIEYYVAHHNGTPVYIKARGCEFPEIAMGKKARCKVTWPRHGGAKVSGNGDITCFASSIELA